MILLCLRSFFTLMRFASLGTLSLVNCAAEAINCLSCLLSTVLLCPINFLKIQRPFRFPSTSSLLSFCFHSALPLRPSTPASRVHEHSNVKRVPAPIVSSSCVQLRDIFCRQGGHVILDMLRLYYRYVSLNMSLIRVVDVLQFTDESLLVLTTERPPFFPLLFLSLSLFSYHPFCAPLCHVLPYGVALHITGKIRQERDSSIFLPLVTCEMCSRTHFIPFVFT
jgi:hypothetical protein